MVNKKRKQIEEAISKISDEGERIDAVAKIQGWFQPDEDSQFYPHVQSYLKGDSSLEDAIKLITEPIDAAIAANRTKDIDFYDVWYSILHSAKRITFRDEASHGKLVELVHAYRKHTGPSHKDSEDIYQDLRNIGIASRETINDCPGCGAGFSEPEIQAWTNLNYFFARLTKTLEGRLDYFMYCIYSMRDGLEEVHKDLPAGLPNSGTASEQYDAFVPAAAVWVFALGKALYEKEEDLTPTSSNEGNPGRGGELWEGKAEFSKERWALWKKRFEEISTMGDVNEETRKIAKEAFEVMNESERP